MASAGDIEVAQTLSYVTGFWGSILGVKLFIKMDPTEDSILSSIFDLLGAIVCLISGVASLCIWGPGTDWVTASLVACLLATALSCFGLGYLLTKPARPKPERKW